MRFLRLLAFAALPVTAAQNPVDPTFHADTRLVQLTVVAHDKNGKAVADLNVDDLEVLDNHQRQTVRFFVPSIDGHRDPPAGFFSNSPPDGQTQGRGPTVFLLDFLTIADDGYSQYRARQKAIDALATLPRGETAALFILDLTHGLTVLHDFTTDTDALSRALRAFPWRTPAPEFDAGNMRQDKSTALMASVENQQKLMLQPSQIYESLRALEALAADLATVPGRKPLIWISGGFPIQLKNRLNFADAVDQTTAKLKAANVSLYAVDSRGLIAPGNPHYQDPWTNADPMWRIATHTGGQLYWNRNDIDGEIRKAFDDIRATYTLGYYRPADGDTTEKHRLKVNSTRKDVEVEFWENEPSGSSASQPLPRQAPVTNADRQDIPLTANVTRRGDSIAISLHLDSKGIGLEENDGHWRGSAEVGAQFAGPDGKADGIAVSRTIKADLAKPAHDKILADGLDYPTTLTIPKQAATLYVRVSDDRSGRTGLLSVPIALIPVGDPPK